MSALRVYRPDECGADGYPFAWHANIKHWVYMAGSGEWSPCDEACRHGGPVRIWSRLLKAPDLHLFATSGEIAAMARSATGVEARWRILTVHHLTREKADCRWWNLAALCQRCHLTIQGKVQMARVWPWPHTDWFRPYAAGWYAWTYLGEEITRAEAVERMDELLALEAA